MCKKAAILENETVHLQKLVSVLRLFCDIGLYDLFGRVQISVS